MTKKLSVVLGVFLFLTTIFQKIYLLKILQNIFAINLMENFRNLSKEEVLSMRLTDVI
ncbi:hypothetical protein [Fodinibius sp. AD559]|uniref:hypothetical protein n=1 Tax=Fodinibius sp. AD559 TaxID=3424179 RepID=UPI004046D194